MQRVRSAVLAFLLAIAGVLAVQLPASAGGPPSTPPTSQWYLSLGDSLAQGVQPLYAPAPGQQIGDTGNKITDQGYPDKLYADLKAQNPALQLMKLGCPGETSTTLLLGSGPCAALYGGGSQLDAAIAFIAGIRASGGEIAYLTISIGANDVLTDSCLVNTQPPLYGEDCVKGKIQILKDNLSKILPALDAAVGPRTAKAGMNFYDPLLGLATLGTGYLDAAAQSLRETNALNRALAKRYDRYGFEVAKVSDAFKINSTRVRSWTNGLPTNV